MRFLFASGLLLAGAGTARAACDAGHVAKVDTGCRKPAEGFSCQEALQTLWADCANEPSLARPIDDPRANPARIAHNLFDAHSFPPPPLPPWATPSYSSTHAKKRPDPAKDAQGLQGKLPASVTGGQPVETDLGKLDVRLEDARRDSDPKGFTQAAAGFLVGGRPEQAAQAADEALALDPGGAGAYTIRSLVRASQGRYREAADDAAQALRLDPENELARETKSFAESILNPVKVKVDVSKIGFPDPARGGADGGPGGGRDARGPGSEAARRADGDFGAPDGSGVTAGGGGPAARATGLQVWQLANRHFSLGDWTSALFHATRYIKLAPNDPRGWLLRARISNRLKNWAAAEADARRALELTPDDPAALLELGYALLQQGRAAEARTHIERALTLDPKNGLGYLYLGQTLEALGLKAEAIEAYRKAVLFDKALKPLADAALARLGAAGDGVPPPAAPPPWRLPLRLFTFAVAAAFLLKGLQVVLGARRRATTGPLPPPDPEDAVLSGTPVPGTVLGGQFRIERELARGGMGVVFEATDTVLNRPVAIKRLNRAASESPDVRRKFLQEAQLAARLKHQNLAQIFSVFGDGELYLVFELVEGTGLDAVLTRRGSLGLGEVRGLMRQACSALSHAHANRVIHRDLKPANMMVARDGTLKLMDFGIAHEARTVSSATATQAWGTPPYMAPEQEDGYVLPASDLYALAVTAYELLSGRRPFDGPGLLGAKRAKSYGRLGGAYDAFFDRALEPDPARRFATAADFAAAFDAIAETPVRP